MEKKERKDEKGDSEKFCGGLNNDWRGLISREISVYVKF